MKKYEKLIKEVIEKNPKVVGVYRLIEGLEFKDSNMEIVLSTLKEKGIDIVIYEPNIKKNSYYGYEIVHDFKLFRAISNIIFVNQEDHKLDDIKTYTKYKKED